jgi:hypothetical protein
LIPRKAGRDVATADIPGAFMQTDLEDMVHMQLEREQWLSYYSRSTQSCTVSSYLVQERKKWLCMLLELRWMTVGASSGGLTACLEYIPT